MGVFIQGEDLSIKALVGHSSAIRLAFDDGFPSFDIPGNVFLAAFTSPNASNSGLFDTCLLYDVSATIQMRWRDDDTGWKGPKTFDAFRVLTMGMP